MTFNGRGVQMSGDSAGLFPFGRRVRADPSLLRGACTSSNDLGRSLNAAFRTCRYLCVEEPPNVKAGCSELHAIAPALLKSELISDRVDHF